MVTNTVLLQNKQEDHDGPISLTGVPSIKGVQLPNIIV